MEHVPEDTREGLHAFAIEPTDAPEVHGVSVVTLERDLDQVHFVASAYVEAEAVLGLRERMSP